MTDKQRSLKQNKYRFGVVVATVLKHMNAELEQEGCEYRASAKDIDLFIKEKALKIVHRIPTSLGDLTIEGKLRNRSTADFEEAMLQVRSYFDKKGIHIPEPNEPDYEDNLERY